MDVTEELHSGQITIVLTEREARRIRDGFLALEGLLPPSAVIPEECDLLEELADALHFYLST